MLELLISFLLGYLTIGVTFSILLFVVCVILEEEFTIGLLSEFLMTVLAWPVVLMFLLKELGKRLIKLLVKGI